MSGVAAEPAIIDEALLRELSAECSRAVRKAEDYRAIAEVEMRQAEELRVVHAWLEQHAGMSLDAAVAAAEAQFKATVAATAAAEAELERAREWRRDLEGYGRVILAGKGKAADER